MIKYIENKSIKFATYWYIRQNQWHSFNKTLIKKSKIEKHLQQLKSQKNENFKI